jgi:hypothetical protein
VVRLDEQVRTAFGEGQRALAGEGIDVRRACRRMAVGTDVIGRQRVDADDENVGWAEPAAGASEFSRPEQEYREHQAKARRDERAPIRG